jgi:2-keto-4-pentenoate hydratase/2-oxohepta-3-ene-1,7-dioic acid hydratase in catechol pathway
MIFCSWISGLLLLAAAAISGYLIFWDLSRRGWQTLSGIQEKVQVAAEPRGTL